MLEIDTLEILKDILSELQKHRHQWVILTTYPNHIGGESATKTYNLYCPECGKTCFAYDK